MICYDTPDIQTDSPIGFISALCFRVHRLIAHSSFFNLQAFLTTVLLCLRAGVRPSSIGDEIQFTSIFPVSWYPPTLTHHTLHRSL